MATNEIPEDGNPDDWWTLSRCKKTGISEHVLYKATLLGHIRWRQLLTGGLRFWGPAVAHFYRTNPPSRRRVKTRVGTGPK